MVYGSFTTKTVLSYEIYLGAISIYATIGVCMDKKYSTNFSSFYTKIMQNNLWVKTIYFNCFDTWLQIQDKQNWAPDLIKALNVDAKKIRDSLLMTNKSLREAIHELMPYVFEPTPVIHKIQAIEAAEQAIAHEIASVVLKSGVAETMQELKRRWYGIGIVSNLSKDYVSVVQEKSPIVFDHHLYSCELWLKKTVTNNEYRIYQQAQQLTGLKKREIVMIGDHYDNDYKAAVDYGINAIHMDRSKTNKAPHGQRVYSMEELLEIFR